MLDARWFASWDRLTPEEELRRSGIFLAWGVSPRVGTVNRRQAPGGGDRSMLGVSSRHHSDISVAAPRLPLFFLLRILGLTPQAMILSPLRGSRSHDNLSPGLDPDAARWYIHLLVNDFLSDKFENLSADQAD